MTPADRHRSGAGVTPRVVSVLIFADEALRNIDVTNRLGFFNGRFAPRAAQCMLAASRNLLPPIRVGRCVAAAIP
jgi:hypothetical protein